MRKEIVLHSQLKCDRAQIGLGPIAFVLIALALLSAAPLAAASDAPWWNTNWLYRIPLVSTNPNTTALPARYSARLMVNTQLFVGTGQVLPNCADLRLVFFDGTVNRELDRIVNGCGSAETEIWFALQRPIAAGEQDAAYYLYYGNSGSAIPPQNGMNVFLFYEDWENNADHWINAGGFDPAGTGTMGTSSIVSDDWVSSGHSQQFTQKTYGGDAFTGFIPVSPNRMYTLSVWATSAMATYFPVGFDPYDVSYNRGNEVWLWTSEWTLTPVLTQRTASFTTRSDVNFIKIKSEWWGEAPGTAPVYSDDLALRYYSARELQVTFAPQESTLPGPIVANVVAISPINIGASTTVTADVDAEGTVLDSVTLHVLSPEHADVPMTSDSSGQTWLAQFTPNQGGVYSLLVEAHSTNSLIGFSATHNFTVLDSQPPQISFVSITETILTNNLQTLTVQVTDNGRIGSVVVDVDGTSFPMVGNGDLYSYSWRPRTAGTSAYTVTATDTVGNIATYSGNFNVEVREADVCTWMGCKQGAESFSVDDGYNSCKTELETAGFRGTYFVDGVTSYSWLALYSATGHEIGSHTATHSCGVPCCSPNCTPQSLGTCPYTAGDVTNYRQNEFEPNIAAIESVTGQAVRVAAWPCGCVDPGREAAAAPYFLGVRGYYDYVASLTWVSDVNYATPSDIMNLWTASSYDESFIDRAAAEGKWAIVVSHGDCTGIDYMGQRSNVLWAATVGEISRYIKVRDAANFTNYTRTAHAITFDGSHNLGVFNRQKVDGSYFLPIVYDNPVTLKLHVFDTDTVVGVQVNGTSVPYSIKVLDGARYVTFDTSLEVNKHVEIALGLPSLSSVQLNPSAVVGGGAVTGTVTLNAKAPTGGATVSLTSSDVTLATAPETVIVPAGLNSENFSVNTASVTSATSLSIAGTYNGATQSAVLTLNPLGISSLTLIPSSVIGGGAVTGTVTLNAPAGAMGAVVSLTSNDPNTATVPANLTVAAGSSTATFSVNTTAVATDTAVSISGTYGSSTQSTTLTVTPIPVALASVSVNPAIVIGSNPSTGTVTLNVAARSPVVVALTSDKTAAQVPSTVTVPQEAISATFPITTSAVSVNTSVTISGANNGQVATASLLVTPIPINIASVGVSPSTLTGGGSATGTVAITTAAPVAITINLSSTNPATQVPATVTVPSGANSATFAITTSAVALVTTGDISASYNGSSQSAAITVNPPVVSSLGLSPATVLGGVSSTGTVTLNGPAPSGGAVVTLGTSNPSAAWPPASVTVAAGRNTATFIVSTSAVSTPTPVTISATCGSTQTATLTVNAASLSSVSLRPTSLTGGTSATATVTLNGAAPIGGAAVSLTSSNQAAALPSSVTVIAGQTTATFSVTTTAVASNTTASISAVYSGVTRMATLTITAPTPSSLSLNPTSIIGGNSSTATVTLNGPAPTGGAIATLASSNPNAALVPTTVTVAAGNRTATFPVTTVPVPANTTSSISVLANGVSRAATITVRAPSLSTLSLNPISVLGGSNSTGTVTLTGTAAINVVITLSSNNTAAATVPGSVTISPGSSTATFSITTKPVSSSTAPTISSIYSGTTRSQRLTVTAPSIAQLALNPTTVKGGNLSTGTVILNGPAPSNGISVTLRSSNTNIATVPSSVIVDGGSTTANFMATSRTVTTTRSVTITGTRNGSRSAVLTVTP